MKNTEQNPAKVYYDLTHKEFWAVYYSIARHNVFLTLNQIFEKTGIEILKSEDEIKKLKEKFEKKISGKGVLNEYKFLELIDKHFPFLEIINQITLDKTKKTKQEYDKGKNIEVLYQLFGFLRNFRNYFCHANPDSKLSDNLNKVEKDLLEAQLKKIFDTNVNKVKQDHNSESNIILTGAIDKEEDYLHLRRYIANKSRNPREKKALPNPNFRYHTLDTNDDFTIYAHILFVSLFLEKRDALELQKKIKGLKDSRQERDKITNEVFCRSRIKLPIIRLNSTVSLNSLSMDMLNELSKAPTEFYSHLTNADKDKFLVKQEEDEDGEVLLGSGFRKESRFTYFALRYFDESNAFTNLRFQLDLGSYHYHLYESLINGEKEERRLTKKLIGYERIQEMIPPNSLSKSTYPEAWKILIKDIEPKNLDNKKLPLPYITNTRPHYHIEDGKIGLKFIDTKEVIFPSIETTTKENSIYPKAKRLEKNREIADVFISVNEIPAMALCYLLYGSKEVEDLIRLKLKNLKSLFNKTLSGEINLPISESTLNKDYKLKRSEIPERLYNYLMTSQIERPSYCSQIEDRLSDLIKDTKFLKEKIERIQRENVAIGKKAYQRLESGRYASWLVDDIMLFQPIEKDKSDTAILRSKANATKYQLIQKTLALYASEKDKLYGLLKECRLIESTNPHPFINNVLKTEPSNWIDFYKTYLKERLNYLETVFKTRDNFSFKQLPFLKIKERPSNAGKLTKGLLDQIYLPVGMFDELLYDYFKKHSNPALNELMQKGKSNPSLYGMVEAYVKYINLDSFQDFYDTMPLLYKVYEKNKSNALNLQQRREFIKTHYPNYKQSAEVIKEVQVKGLKEKVDAIVKEINKEKIESLQTIVKLFENRLNIKLNYIDSKLGILTPKKLITKIENEVLRKDMQSIYDNTKELMSNEKTIRAFKTEDGILSGLVRMALSENELSNFKLNEIAPIGDDTTTGFLNKVQDLEYPLSIYKMDDKGEFVMELNSKNNNQKVKLGDVIIFSKGLKLKNKGTFFYRLKDRRLNNMLQYIQSFETLALSDSKPCVDKIRIDEELKLYEKARIKLVNKSLELEGTIISNWASSEPMESGNFRKLLEGYNKGNPVFVESDIKKMCNIRNACLHNQYPLFDLFKEDVQPFQPDISEVDLPINKGLNVMLQLEEIGTKLYEHYTALIKTKGTIKI